MVKLLKSKPMHEADNFLVLMDQKPTDILDLSAFLGGYIWWVLSHIIFRVFLSVILICFPGFLV